MTRLLLLLIVTISTPLFTQSFKELNVTGINLNSNISNSTFTYFISGSSSGSSVTYTLPAEVGSIGEFLSTLGNGTLTWTTVTGGSAVIGGSNSNIQYNNSGAFDGSDDLIWDNTNNRLAIGKSSANYTLDVDGEVLLGQNGSDGELIIFSEQGGSDYEVVFRPNASMSTSTTYILPNSDGSAGDILVTDGEGNLYWTSDSVNGSLPCNGQGTGGGSGNSTTGDDSFIGGGTGNIVDSDGNNAVIGAGSGNQAEGDRSAIVGGVNNYTSVDAPRSTIGTGANNTITDNDAFIAAGSGNFISDNKSFIGAGSDNYILSNRAAIPGGQSNTISSSEDRTIIGAGFSNLIQNGGVEGGIVSGYNNFNDNADQSVIAGGRDNTLSANRTFLGSGRGNFIDDASESGIGGGYQNYVLDDHASIIGGSSNTITGNYAFAGGYLSEANGNRSFAIGRRAKANNNGGFQFADASDVDMTSSANDRMEMRFVNGYRFFTSTNQLTGAFFGPGDNSWSYYSDINKKEKLVLLDNKNFSEKLLNLNIYSWNYKADIDSNNRHYGPMAQDVFNLFGTDQIGKFGSEKKIVHYHLPSIGIVVLKEYSHQIEMQEQEIEVLKQEELNILKELEQLELKILELEVLGTNE